MSEERRTLSRRLAAAWSADTATAWRDENPAPGQCSVTAPVAQDLVAGLLLRTRTGSTATEARGRGGLGALRAMPSRLTTAFVGKGGNVRFATGNAKGPGGSAGAFCASGCGG